MRKFLVMLDDSRECLNAMRFAAMRASRSEGGLVVLSVIPAEDIQYGIGVADVMRAEARERIESHFNVFAKWMRDRPKVEPDLVIREGDPATELIALLEEDPSIGVVVLGSSGDKSGPGPLITKLLRDVGRLPCPLTIVPSDISRERLEEIT